MNKVIKMPATAKLMSRSLVKQPDLADLTKLCRLANRVGRQINGRRDTCVQMCAALYEVLGHLGIPAEFLRVRVSVHCGCCSSPRSTHYGCVLGSDGDGTRRPAAHRDAWHGHLVVTALGCYLLDPTLDQVNKGHPWLKAEPFVAEVTPAFLRGKESLMSTTGKAGSSVCYSAYPGRGGYRSAPDMRPSHRRDIVRKILEKLPPKRRQGLVETLQALHGPGVGAER
jgi:hypothetical protein